VPYVKRWLSAHPAGDDPDAYLWSHLNRPERVSRSLFNRLFKQAADRADVQKAVTPTNFRKSSAAHLASKGMNQAHLEDHHGWVRGSDACARYIAVFGEDTERELARLHGRAVSGEEPDRIDPIECPTCEHANERAASFCARCGQVLDPGTASEVDRVDTDIRQQLATLDPEQAEGLVALADRLEDDPELLAALID